MAARQLLSPTRIGFFGILLRDSFYFDAIVIIIFLDFSKFLSKGFCQHSPDVIRNLQRFPPPPPTSSSSFVLAGFFAIWMRKVVAFISGLKLHVGFSAGFFVESFMGPTTRDPLRDSLWLTPLLEILFATGFLASKEGDFLCAAVSLLVSVCFMFEVGFSGDSLRFFGNRQPWPLWSPESIAESINKCTQQIERDEIKAGASSMASLPPLMLWESQESYPSPFLQDAAIPEKKNSGKMKRQSIKKKSNVEMAGIT